MTRTARTGSPASTWPRAETTETISVAMPTAGVFAEAVLGRSNSAERLDITRFWDWQSSPIPIVAPEISQVSTDSRARAADVGTGELAPTAATIQVLPALPTPSGLDATLSALTASGTFRDLSGLDAAATVMQKGIEQATTADTAAAANATEAMRVAGQNITALAKVAADAAPTLLSAAGGPAGAVAAKLGPSLLGALLNASTDPKGGPTS